jgi:uncharacterized damage-inducible protein DinB
MGAIRREEAVAETLSNTETELLIKWLDGQRRHAIAILDGLSDEDLRRPVLPSGWSCLGMIGHLAGVERFWYQRVLLGDRDARSDLPVSIEWQVPPEISVDAVFASYRREIELANTIIRATPLETEPLWWPEFFADFRLQNLREIILHTMTEIAAHAGQLDAVRELLDGRQWLVLDE